MANRRRERRRSGGNRASAGAAERSAASDSAAGSAFPLGEFAALLVVFLCAAFFVYAPALSGPFLSDDLHYVATNPYVHDLSLENLLAIWSPTSAATVFVVNYTPVHLTLHALEWSAFGDQTTGFHVVNVLLHALGSALLAALFLQVGLSRVAAALGGALFLLHPANVEAVAWVSQLKTTASFVLAIAALLAHPRRPLLGASFFALALLAKPTAAFALPVAGLLDWTRYGRVRMGWLALWAAALAGYAAVEFWTHTRSGAALPIDPDPVVWGRSIVAFAGRYLWMAATALGVSAFHEPGPSLSFADPWFLLGAVGVVALGVRAVVTLLRRSPEAAFWGWAAASFVPVSQLFPFLHPIGDRYLYFILPGLLGGVLFALRDAAGWLAARRGAPFAARAETVAIAAGVALCLAFGAHAHTRARLWTSATLLVVDSARNYPDGRTAHLMRAKRAASVGDPDGAIDALRGAWERGFNRFEQLQSDPAYASLHGDPRFQALVAEVASWWITKLESNPQLTQMELRTLAVAHLARGEKSRALERLEQALERGGPLDERLRGEIDQVRRAN